MSHLEIISKSLFWEKMYYWHSNQTGGAKDHAQCYSCRRFETQFVEHFPTDTKNVTESTWKTTIV